MVAIPGDVAVFIHPQYGDYALKFGDLVLVDSYGLTTNEFIYVKNEENTHFFFLKPDCLESLGPL